MPKNRAESENMKKIDKKNKTIRQKGWSESWHFFWKFYCISSSSSRRYSARTELLPSRFWQQMKESYMVYCRLKDTWRIIQVELLILKELKGLDWRNWRAPYLFLLLYAVKSGKSQVRTKKNPKRLVFKYLHLRTCGYWEVQLTQLKIIHWC